MHSWRTSEKEDTRWYLGVLCQHCDAPILFGLDLSDGEGRLGKCLRLVLTCARPGCRRQADYTDATVSRYRKADDPVGPLNGTNRP